MSDTPHYDLIVIGTGPGGEGAAMQTAKAGKSVAAVEQYVEVGGGCTHWGTIPSKALRQAIHHAGIIHQNPLYKRLDVSADFSFPELLSTANHVIEQQASLRESFYDRNHVPLLCGHARFVDPHTIEVANDAGASSAGHPRPATVATGGRRYTADTFVIATGSRPVRPQNVDFNHPRIFDSDTLLKLDRTPSSIAVYGAGVIGCEYASMLNNMECDVELINTRDKLLAFLDDEIIDALSYHFSDQGIRIHHSEEYEKVEPTDKEVIVHLKSGKRIKSDILLWASGRTGNTENLGLDAAGVTVNARGQIEINEHYQTKQANIYAVGDCVGSPSLASASYDQGRFAASHICNQADYRLVQDIPAGIYTSPEISCLGKTERQLTAYKVPYEVGRSPFKSLARAQITGTTVGMLKLIFHRETLALLGIHCFGHSSAEIVHIGQAIMSQPPPNNTLRYFVNTTFNYPTMAEAYRVAALNGLNRLC